MAKAFANTQGKAQKKSYEAYEYKDGENTVRLVGGVLPRYVYWLKGSNNKDIPVECLAFNREDERFDNAERDYVQEFFPDKKCSWSYAVNCIDIKGDGKVKVLQLKKKLFEQIITAAADLGDPTDPVTGWDVVFRKAKTGSMVFNVEYTLQVLRCKPRALTQDELTAVAEAVDIDVKFPRPTAEDIKKLLERITTGEEDSSDKSEESNASKEAINELG